MLRQIIELFNESYDLTVKCTLNELIFEYIIPAVLNESFEYLKIKMQHEAITSQVFNFQNLISFFI